VSAQQSVLTVSDSVWCLWYCGSSANCQQPVLFATSRQPLLTTRTSLMIISHHHAAVCTNVWQV